MAIYISAYSAPRTVGGRTTMPTLHLHQDCPGAGCDGRDFIVVNYIGEAYAIMRALKSALRHDEGKGRYVRNRIHTFQIWGDVADEYLTRADVAALEISRSHPDHEDYADWRAVRIQSAPAGERAVTECAMISPALARALGIKGVHLWEDADNAPRSATLAGVKLTAYSHTSAPYPGGLEARRVLRFGAEGYTFRVPGHTAAQAVEADYAVFQRRGKVAGTWMWAVLAVSDGQQMGPDAETRREAVSGARSAIEEHRARHAARVADTRTAVLGLDAVPPVRLTVSEVGSWMVHVRCTHEIAPGDLLAEAETPGDVVEFFEGDDAPWMLCRTTPRTLHAEDGTPVGEITKSGARGPQGEPSVFVQPADGREGYALRLTAMHGRALH
jgi:hypothetical protein